MPGEKAINKLTANHREPEWLFDQYVFNLRGNIGLTVLETFFCFPQTKEYFVHSRFSSNGKIVNFFFFNLWMWVY